MTHAVPSGVTTAEGAAAADPLEAGTAVLNDAARVRYRIRQTFAYTYDGPAHDLDHRLVVVPPVRHGDQTRLMGTVEVSDPAARTTWERTRDGCPAVRVRLDEIPREIDFEVLVVVERVSGAGPPRLPASALTGRRLLTPTALTMPDATIRSVASSLSAADPLETARRFCAWVHERIAYVGGATDVATTASQALAGGAGVCQDHAHVMLALCRAAGVPARYVSGHLLGDGGTHAWVEILAPDAGGPGGTGGSSGTGGYGPAPAGARAVAFDPCHGRPADRRYVTVAIGRDYGDVAPTSGSYRGRGQGILTASKRVDVIDITST